MGAWLLGNICVVLMRQLAPPFHSFALMRLLVLTQPPQPSDRTAEERGRGNAHDDEGRSGVKMPIDVTLRGRHGSGERRMSASPTRFRRLVFDDARRDWNRKDRGY